MRACVCVSVLLNFVFYIAAEALRAVSLLFAKQTLQTCLFDFKDQISCTVIHSRKRARYKEIARSEVRSCDLFVASSSYAYCNHAVSSWLSWLLLIFLVYFSMHKIFLDLVSLYNKFYATNF